MPCGTCLTELAFGLLNVVQAFLTQAEAAFAVPASRLQLLILLDCFTLVPEFQSHAADFARHPLMNCLLNSLLLDNSSTLCKVGLTILVKLLPVFAVTACEELKILLPRLFAVLARVVCWEERLSTIPSPSLLVDDDDRHSGIGNQADEYGRPAVLELRPELGWERLEHTPTESCVPPSDGYFSCLYYLFPCNLLRFFQGPAAYLRDRKYESPYTVSWEDVLDEDNIRSKSEVCIYTVFLSFRLFSARCRYLSTHFSRSFAAARLIHVSYGGTGSRNLPNPILGPTVAFLA